MENSIINKLTDVVLVDAQFTNDKGQQIPYKQVVFKGVINGNSVDVPVTIKADKALILSALADLDDSDFLPEATDKK